MRNSASRVAIVVTPTPSLLIFTNVKVNERIPCLKCLVSTGGKQVRSGSFASLDLADVGVRKVCLGGKLTQRIATLRAHSAYGLAKGLQRRPLPVGGSLLRNVCCSCAHGAHLAMGRAYRRRYRYGSRRTPTSFPRGVRPNREMASPRDGAVVEHQRRTDRSPVCLTTGGDQQPAPPASSLPRISRAGWQHIEPISELIATAVASLSYVASLVPNHFVRHAVLAAQSRIVVEHALVFGGVNWFDDGSGVVVWFDRSRRIPPPPDYAQRLANACGPYVEQFRLIGTLLDEHHPTTPHAHLAVLAVAPDSQGTGRGSALLCRLHSYLDDTGCASYLTASSPTSRDVFLRHGYQVQCTGQFPNHSPFYGMLRPSVSKGVTHEAEI